MRAYFRGKREVIVLIILQIFIAARTVLEIENITRILPSFSLKIVTHVTRLAQSC